MQSFRKSIEFFSEDKYRALDYGTVYYVAGTASTDINNYILSQIDSIDARKNADKYNWVIWLIRERKKQKREIYLHISEKSCTFAALFNRVLPSTRKKAKLAEFAKV